MLYSEPIRQGGPDISKSQGGFFLMMATVIIIVLGVIISIGYVVWHRQSVTATEKYSNASQ